MSEAGEVEAHGARCQRRKRVMAKCLDEFSYSAGDGLEITFSQEVYTFTAVAVSGEPGLPFVIVRAHSDRQDDDGEVQVSKVEVYSIDEARFLRRCLAEWIKRQGEWAKREETR